MQNQDSNNQEDLRIYIIDKDQVCSINKDIVGMAVDWMPSILKPITKIFDIKTQFQLNAKWMIDSESELLDFNQKVLGCGMVLGASQLLCEQAYKLENVDEDFSGIDSIELMRTPEYQEFLRSEKAENIMNLVSDPNEIVEYENIEENLLKVAGKITECTNDKNNLVMTNLKSLFDKKGEFIIKFVSGLQDSMKNHYNSINLMIKSNGKKANVFFNATEEEYNLLDKWLNMDELRLELVNKHYIVENEEHLIDWYNKLRSRLESECSLVTLNEHIKRNMGDSAEKYLQKVSDKIAYIIAYSEKDSDYERRLEIIEFLNGMINTYNKNDNKQFNVFSINDIHLFEDKDGYIMSLYK